MSNAIPPSLPPPLQPLGPSGDGSQSINNQIVGAVFKIDQLMTQQILHPSQTNQIAAQIQTVLEQMQTAVNTYVTAQPAYEESWQEMLSGKIDYQAYMNASTNYNAARTEILKFAPEVSDTAQLLTHVQMLLSYPASSTFAGYVKDAITKLQQDQQSEDPQTQKDMDTLLNYVQGYLENPTFSESNTMLQTTQGYVNKILSDLGINP